MDIILQEMIELGADGIDFIPLFHKGPVIPIIATYTKEELECGVNSYPKTGRRYWKMENGKKCLLSKSN